MGCQLRVHFRLDLAELVAVHVARPNAVDRRNAIKGFPGSLQCGNRVFESRSVRGRCYRIDLRKLFGHSRVKRGLEIRDLDLIEWWDAPIRTDPFVSDGIVRSLSCGRFG